MPLIKPMVTTEINKLQFINLFTLMQFKYLHNLTYIIYERRIGEGRESVPNCDVFPPPLSEPTILLKIVLCLFQ